MADYDRRSDGPRGGYNNNRKRRHRGTFLRPINLHRPDLCMQMMMNTAADRNAEDMRNRCISKCGSSFWGSQNQYVKLVTHGSAVILRANGTVAVEEDR